MKKLLVIGALYAFSAPGAYAYKYITWCGIEVETVSPDYFTDKNGDVVWEDAMDYYMELDEVYCG